MYGKARKGERRNTLKRENSKTKTFKTIRNKEEIYERKIQTTAHDDKKKHEKDKKTLKLNWK